MYPARQEEPAATSGRFECSLGQGERFSHVKNATGRVGGQTSVQKLGSLSSRRTESGAGSLSAIRRSFSIWAVTPHARKRDGGSRSSNEDQK